MKVVIKHHRRVIRGDIEYPRQRKGKLPAVLLVHGFTSHRNRQRYLKLSNYLVRAGYVVLRIDLYGHGESDGELPRFTYTKAIQDIFAARQFLTNKERINQHAIAGIGSSLGGAALLLAHAQGARFKSLILIAPVADTQWHYRRISVWKRRYEIATLDKQWKDSEKIDQQFMLKPSFFVDVFRLDTLQSAREIHQPVLIIHGTADRSVPMSETRRLFKILGEPKQLQTIRGAGHGRDLWRGRRQQFIFQTIERWLKQYVGNRTSRSVVAFIMHEGRILILKRSRDVGYHRGTWGVIAGHLPPGRSPLTQAYEEVREEAGLKRSELRLIRIGSVTRIPDPGVGKVWLSTPTVFVSKSSRIKLNWEHTDYRWVRPERFPVKQCYPGMEQQLRAAGLR